MTIVTQRSFLYNKETLYDRDPPPQTLSPLCLPLPPGANLDVMVPSESVCGREKTKKVSSTIMFHCSPTAGVGIPEFMLETDSCQYLFVWHTTAVCDLM